MMARPIRLWNGRRPAGSELEARIRRELRIVRADGDRAVRARLGKQIRVELERVRDHVGLSSDPTRWRLIPLIIPTIKRGERQRGDGEPRRGLSHPAPEPLQKGPPEPQDASWLAMTPAPAPWLSTRVLLAVVLLFAACAPANHPQTPPAPPSSLALSPAPAPSLARSPSAAAAACSYREAGALPDPACTPGAVNPDVRPDNISSTICAPGWTATIRPPVSFTESLKVQQMRAYGVEGRPASTFEEDHLVPLELGGAPRDPRNLWPQSEPFYPMKDQVENAARAAVCAGRMQLAEAQQRIAHDWRQLGRDLGVP